MVYHKLAPLYGWTWEDFYFSMPWWRVKELSDLLDENLEKEKGIISIQELMILKAVSTCLGGNSDG